MEVKKVVRLVRNDKTLLLLKYCDVSKVFYNNRNVPYFTRMYEQQVSNEP